MNIKHILQKCKYLYYRHNSCPHTYFILCKFHFFHMLQHKIWLLLESHNPHSFMLHTASLLKFTSIHQISWTTVAEVVTLVQLKIKTKKKPQNCWNITDVILWTIVAEIVTLVEWKQKRKKKKNCWTITDVISWIIVAQLVTLVQRKKAELLHVLF